MNLACKFDVLGTQYCTGLQVTILNTVNTKLSFLPADEDMEVKEEVRLRTRVLDLRCAAPTPLPGLPMRACSGSMHVMLHPSKEGMALPHLHGMQAAAHGP